MSAYNNFKSTVNDLLNVATTGNMNLISNALNKAIYGGTIFIMSQHKGNINADSILSFLRTEIDNRFFIRDFESLIKNAIMEGMTYYNQHKNNTFNNSFNNSFSNGFNNSFNSFNSTDSGMILKGELDSNGSNQNKYDNFTTVKKEEPKFTSIFEGFERIEQKEPINKVNNQQQAKSMCKNVGIINGERYLLETGIYVKNNELCGNIESNTTLLNGDNGGDIDYEDVKEDIIVNYENYYVSKTYNVNYSKKFYKELMNRDSDYILGLNLSHNYPIFIPIMARYCKVVSDNLIEDRRTILSKIDNIESIKVRQDVKGYFENAVKDCEKISIESKEGKNRAIVKMSDINKVTFIYNKEFLSKLKNIENGTFIYYIVNDLSYPALYEFLNKIDSNEVFIFDKDNYINFAFCKDIKNEKEFILYIYSIGETNGY